jgi:hypothetical protein
MPELPEVIGIIYPLPKEMIERVFNKKKNVFVKFTTHEPTRKTEIRIRKGIRLYLYQSGSKKIIVGDATISNFEYLYVEDVLKKYETNLIIPKKDLRLYSKGREHKKLLVLHLKDLRKYKIPLKMKKSITMTGQYITIDNKKSLFV